MFVAVSLLQCLCCSVVLQCCVPVSLLRVMLQRGVCCSVDVAVSCCSVVVARGVCCSFGVAVSVLQHHCCSVGVVVSCCIVVVARGVCCSFGVAVSLLQYHCCSVVVAICFVAAWCCCLFHVVFSNTKDDLDGSFVAVSLLQYRCCSVNVAICFVAAWCCCFMWCFQLFLNTKADVEVGFVLYFEKRVLYIMK